MQIYRAMRLLFAGEYDQAEAAGLEAARVGQRVQDTNTGNATLLQSLMLRRERGRLERLEGPVRSYAERFATIPGWRCVLALAARRDRPRRTRRARSSTASRPTTSASCRSTGSGSARSRYLAEAAAALGDATHAAALYELLEPYADRNVAIGWASTCAGSAARHLGLLADLLGKREQAVAHFETALAMNERMRARPWVARTQVELARVLLQTARRP